VVAYVMWQTVETYWSLHRPTIATNPNADPEAMPQRAAAVCAAVCAALGRIQVG
jgi:hypothetical protein